MYMHVHMNMLYTVQGSMKHLRSEETIRLKLEGNRCGISDMC